jgi:hypothetical protein
MLDAAAAATGDESRSVLMSIWLQYIYCSRRVVSHQKLICYWLLTRFHFVVIDDTF